MRLIDADELEKQLIQNLNDITKGEENDYMWKVVYSIIVVYINTLEKVPTVTSHYDCNHDCDALHDAYNRGFSKGIENVLIAEECMKKYRDINKKMEEQAKKQMEDYCKNDCDATKDAYDRGYSKGFSEGREEEKKEVMLLTDHCIRKCDILENVLNMEGDKND